jgi:hypothetical protein
MGLGFSGADIMSLPPDMLRMIMQLLQSGQYGTPQGFEQLLGGPNMTGQGAQMGGRKNWMREHPQFDPFGWEEFTKGTDFDPYSKPRPMTAEELGTKSNIENFSRDLTPQEIAQIKAIKQDPKNWDITGQALIDKLPPQFNTPEYQKLAANYQPFEKFNPLFQWPGIAGPNDVMTTPPSRDEAQFNAAEALGYGGKSLLQRGKGAQGVNDVINTANALQTLKSAGWDKSMGYGPQANLSDKMNQLLFAVAPDYDKSKIPVPQKDPRLDYAYDPFGGMQSAINRDAYVNETLGGGFYGGVIPEEKEQRWGIFEHGGMGRGMMSDPHFPIMQRDPTTGDPNYSPGWASNQAQQFGSLPYEMFGQQINDINHPEREAMGRFAGNMGPNTAPPTWNGGNPTPWPMSGGGGKNVWGAPWGGGGQSNPTFTTPNSSQAQAYQNGPSANPNPWLNPWAMK